jgi:hypothetical protein
LKTSNDRCRQGLLNLIERLLLQSKDSSSLLFREYRFYNDIISLGLHSVIRGKMMTLRRLEVNVVLGRVLQVANLLI